MKRLVVIAAGSLLLLGVAGCGGTASVSAADVEQQISDQLAAQVGSAPESVSCPGDLNAEVGATMTCDLTDGGQTIPVTVTVTSVEGSTVNFDIST